jgi:hypothetical protein
MSAGKVSRSGTGKVKLEYLEGKEKRFALWEPFEKGIVETVFDEHGAVLKQELFQGGKNPIIEVDNYMKRFMNQVHLDDTVDETYSEIKLDKKCPTCENDSLKRILDLAKEPSVPIMPTYVCTTCNGKCYYLSDTYLESLVSNNTSMFSDTERKELEANKEAFLHELKEYIIRIFASKRIIRIK